MSRIGGSWTHPASSATSRTSTAAPHAGQFNTPGPTALVRPHHRQAYSRGPAIGSPGVVVVVHRLDAEPARAGHPDEARARPAEQAGGQPLHLDLHRHRGVLVEEG